MVKTRIIINSNDHERLLAMLAEHRRSHGESLVHLQALERELKDAEIVPPQQIPADVVTMNSTVQVREGRSKRTQTWTVVYPERADIEDGRISVLAPIGTALLGYRAGDMVEWEVPGGARTFHIVEVLFQPEAAGRYDL